VRVRRIERPRTGFNSTATVHVPRRAPRIADPEKTHVRRPIEMLILIVPWERRGMAIPTAPASVAAVSDRPRRTVRVRFVAAADASALDDTATVEVLAPIA